MKNQITTLSHRENSDRTLVAFNLASFLWQLYGGRWTLGRTQCPTPHPQPCLLLCISLLVTIRSCRFLRSGEGSGLKGVSSGHQCYFSFFPSSVTPEFSFTSCPRNKLEELWWWWVWEVGVQGKDSQKMAPPISHLFSLNQRKLKASS